MHCAYWTFFLTMELSACRSHVYIHSKCRYTHIRTPHIAQHTYAYVITNELAHKCEIYKIPIWIQGEHMDTHWHMCILMTPKFLVNAHRLSTRSNSFQMCKNTKKRNKYLSFWTMSIISMEMFCWRYCGIVCTYKYNVWNPNRKNRRHANDIVVCKVWLAVRDTQSQTHSFTDNSWFSQTIKKNDVKKISLSF